MTNNPTLEIILNRVVESYTQNQYPDSSDITELSHQRYEPAKQFFINRLDDTDEEWLYISLCALGFHFILDDNLMQKVKYISVHHPSSEIRGCAISVWNSQKQEIDPHLLFVLDNDPDIYVKENVLDCILTKYIYQIRPLWIRDVKQKIRNGEIMLNVVGISEFLAGFGVKLLND